MALTYTNIQHGFRKLNKLSLNEYVLCDMIYFLSNKSSSDVPGWCYMTKCKMADEVGVSKRTIINLIGRLIDGGFLVKNDTNSHLKTTDKWQDVYFANGAKSAPKEECKKFTYGAKSAPLECKKFTVNGAKSAPNNNIYNNIYNNISLKREKEFKIFENENPIIFEGIFKSHSFIENLQRSLEADKLKYKATDLAPIIFKFYADNFYGENLKANVGIIKTRCISYVKAVISSGGLKNNQHADHSENYRNTNSGKIL